MYFCIAEQELTEFPYRHQLAPHLWVNAYYDINQDKFFGYRLGEHGGNFVEFEFGDEEVTVEFSFYKDFNLGFGKGIILTNINKYIDTAISPLTVKFNCHDELGINWLQYKKIKSAIVPEIKTWEQVLVDIELRLLSNLQTCANISDKTQIAFSGGLDSSTLAFLALHHQVEFTGVVANHTRSYFNKLPFDVVYSDTQETIDYPYSQIDNVKPAFYNINNLVTGYYGDLALLHHGELYAQSSELVDQKFDCYDTATYGPEHAFDNVNSLRSAIVKLHSRPTFQQWFGDFQILDPYRDPELFLTVISLDTEDLVKQLATGQLQKDLIDRWNPSWLSHICKHKNEY
jgi:hypothetical protein